MSSSTVEPVSSGYCMSRPPLSTVEPVSSGYCMSRPPLSTVEPVSSGYCMSRPPLSTVTCLERDRFHCRERWPAHTVTGPCLYSDH